MSQALIAIVDDEAPVRDATKSLVRSLGYHASTFASADDFLKSEQVHDTSCLITDVQMPGLSGIDLQDRLIARGYCIPIIFMTGYPDDNVRARAMKAGAVCFLGCVDGFDQDEAESKRDERAVILRRLLASKCDTLEAFELADSLFNACPCLVECFRKEGGHILGVGSIRDCRTYSALARGVAV